jgi:hypothetical protein
VVKDGYCIICLTKATATGFSGEVPQDQGTSINQYNPASKIGAPVNFNLNETRNYMVSLDGRLVPVQSESSVLKPALLVARTNNSTFKTIRMAK